MKGKKETNSHPQLLMTVKAIMQKYGISRYAIYKAIKDDPTFPLTNLGPKKCYRVNYIHFEEWINNRSRCSNINLFPVPTGQDLLKKIEK